MDTNYVIQLFADFISRSDPNILKYLINYNIDLHEAYPDSFPKPHVVNFFINLLGLDRKGMIDRVVGGQGVIADVPLLKNSWAYYSGNQRVDQNGQDAVLFAFQGARRHDGRHIAAEPHEHGDE